MRISFSVPASFLLSGEYCITQNGGLGIAAAGKPAVRVHVHIHRSSAGNIRCISRMGKSYSKENLLSKRLHDPLLLAARDSWEREVGSLKNIPVSADIHIDSTSFFHSDGSKRGFGSSAAACVAICTALAHLHPRGLLLTRLNIARIANNMHRRFQGGRGSGYDVYTSTLGGLGLFRGGINPRWIPLNESGFLLQEKYLMLWIINSQQVVSSPESIKSLNQLQEKDPKLFEQLFDDNQILHTSFSDGDDLLAFLKQARDIGLRIGEAIGVSAQPPECIRTALKQKADNTTRILKASGAGNEAIIAAGWNNKPMKGAQKFELWNGTIPLPREREF